MINLCLVVIATQFSETKKREMERMRQERARYQSTSTLASMSASESTSCYRQIIKYIAHLWRRSKRRLLRRYRAYRSRKRQERLRSLNLQKRQRRKEKRHLPQCPNFNKSAQELTTSPNATSTIALKINEVSTSVNSPPLSPESAVILGSQTNNKGKLSIRIYTPYFIFYKCYKRSPFYHVV